MEQVHPNFHVLDDRILTLDGHRFVGATLWFRDDPAARPFWRNLNDFNVISGFSGWAFDANQKSEAFLRSQIGPGDVVITHHIPVPEGSAAKWRGSRLQPFFLCDVSEVAKAGRPALWVYGHTHDSHDFVLDGTRFVCNPFGYAGREENPDFNPSLFVDL